MKNWRGIAGDVMALSDGATFVRNASFDVDGELRRRLALERMLSDSSQRGMLTYGAPNGGKYVVLVDGSGNVDLVEAM